MIPLLSDNRFLVSRTVDVKGVGFLAQVDVLQGKSKTAMEIAAQKTGSVMAIVMTVRGSTMAFPFSLTVISSTVMKAIVLMNVVYVQALALL